MDGLSALTSSAVLYGELGQVPAATASKYLLGQAPTPTATAQDPTEASDAQLLSSLGSGPTIGDGSLEGDAVLLGQLEQAGPSFAVLLGKLGQNVDASA